MVSAALRFGHRSFFMHWAAEIKKTGQSEKQKRLNAGYWTEYLYPKAQRWAGWRGLPWAGWGRLLWNAVFWTWRDHHTPKLRAAVVIYTRPIQHQLGTVQMNGHSYSYWQWRVAGKENLSLFRIWSLIGSPGSSAHAPMGCTHVCELTWSASTKRNLSTTSGKSTSRKRIL